MTDRFDFEQQIMKCWMVTDDINTVYNHVMDADKLDRDKIANTLSGIQHLYELKFNELFNQFEALVKHKKIS